MHFSLKIRHLVATILMIFLRVLSKNFLWPHSSGAPGARGPRFIEPPEPPVPTPLHMSESGNFRVVYSRHFRLRNAFIAMPNVAAHVIRTLAAEKIKQTYERLNAGINQDRQKRNKLTISINKARLKYKLMKIQNVDKRK